MKTMMKMLALLMVLALCFTGALAEEEIAPQAELMELPEGFTRSMFADESGEWQLELQWYNSGVMYVTVDHVLNDSEAEIWSIQVENAFDGDVFDYQDSYKVHAAMNMEDGSMGEVEIEYEDGTGTITMDGETLTWQENGGEPIFMALVSASTTVNYTDSVSGKAEMMTTSETEDNAWLDCVIVWDLTENESRTWNMRLEWSDADNLYTYSDCTCMKTIVNGDEFTNETVYSNGSGTFTVMSDGALVWLDSTDGTGSGCRFEMNTIII